MSQNQLQTCIIRLHLCENQKLQLPHRFNFWGLKTSCVAFRLPFLCGRKRWIRSWSVLTCGCWTLTSFACKRASFVRNLFIPTFETKQTNSEEEEPCEHGDSVFWGAAHWFLFSGMWREGALPVLKEAVTRREVFPLNVWMKGAHCESALSGGLSLPAFLFPVESVTKMWSSLEFSTVYWTWKSLQKLCFFCVHSPRTTFELALELSVIECSWKLLGASLRGGFFAAPTCRTTGTSHTERPLKSSTALIVAVRASPLSFPVNVV